MDEREYQERKRRVEPPSGEKQKHLHRKVLLPVPPY